MIIAPTIRVHRVPSLHEPARWPAPIELFPWPQRPAQVVRQGFRFDVVVVLEGGVLDRGAGAAGAGPGCEGEVRGLVGVAAGGVLGAGSAG